MESASTGRTAATRIVSGSILMRLLRGRSRRLVLGLHVDDRQNWRFLPSPFAKPSSIKKKIDMTRPGGDMDESPSASADIASGGRLDKPGFSVRVFGRKMDAPLRIWHGDVM